MAELFLKDVKFVQTIARILKHNPSSLFKKFFKEPTEFAKDLGKLGPKGRKEFREEIDKAREAYEYIKEPEKAFNKALTSVQKKAEQKAKVIMKGDDDQSSLSSSWLIHGLYSPVSIVGTSGDLTITTKTGDSYTYPGVPKIV